MTESIFNERCLIDVGYERKGMKRRDVDVSETRLSISKRQRYITSLSKVLDILDDFLRDIDQQVKETREYDERRKRISEEAFFLFPHQREEALEALGERPLPRENEPWWVSTFDMNHHTWLTRVVDYTELKCPHCFETVYFSYLSERPELCTTDPEEGDHDTTKWAECTMRHARMFADGSIPVSALSLVPDHHTTPMKACRDLVDMCETAEPARPEAVMAIYMFIMWMDESYDCPHIKCDKVMYVSITQAGLSLVATRPGSPFSNDVPPDRDTNHRETTTTESISRNGGGTQDKTQEIIVID
jgi:hypothetical protein